MNEKEILGRTHLLTVIHDDLITDKDTQALQSLLDLYETQKNNYNQLFKEYNKRVGTIIAYEQGLKEIIDAEDDPDTWAYYAVKKLLKEVGNINYE